jgi:hypothetical protein
MSESSCQSNGSVLGAPAGSMGAGFRLLLDPACPNPPTKRRRYLEPL